MTDFEKYIQRYLDLVPDEEWIDALDIAGGRTFGIFSDLTEEQGLFAYDNGKWTLKELLQHLIDTEKVFAYRAMTFARQDQTELPGFDEELWAKNSHANDRSLENLIDEFSFVRKGSILFFDDLSGEVLQLKGAANGNALSVETIGKLIVGHNIHHLNIIEERYLSKLKS
ncbi:DinB superfamily protein [Soonwooa buanensis]|uniref:DinB superfamily protein n=1 Tax=Soonwooa buanensis TaxID=619805 RepID=A0A1T5GP66_9FLAO|nr:DinB family protein [Soonwooa buanensis]SKC10193.1 DinB superfamily protein [Soonwooa buanensis]